MEAASQLRDSAGVHRTFLQPSRMQLQPKYIGIFSAKGPRLSTAAEFTGSIPTTYDRYLGPVLFEPFAADLVGRIQPRDGLRVLELACGTGIVTRRLRAVLPLSATLVATDLNAAMLTYARAAVTDPGIAWQTADAQALPFPDAAFDVVVCQFGMMFLPDKPQGFREARRVLDAGGQLFASVWCSMDDNPYARAMHARLARLFPDDPPRFLETPHGYATDQLRADLAAAGWEQFHLEHVRLPGASPSAAEFMTGFVRGSPLSHELLNRGADLEVIVRELGEALIPVGGERPFTTTLAATLVTAKR